MNASFSGECNCAATFSHGATFCIKHTLNYNQSPKGRPYSIAHMSMQSCESFRIYTVDCTKRRCAVEEKEVIFGPRKTGPRWMMIMELWDDVNAKRDFLNARKPATAIIIFFLGAVKSMPFLPLAFLRCNIARSEHFLVFITIKNVNAVLKFNSSAGWR